MNDFSGDSILNEWSETCAHHIGFYTIPCDYNTYYWWANPSVFEWLRQYKSLRMQGLWRLDLIEILPRFPYVCTDSLERIYDTSINEVVDIPCSNSPYYVVYMLLPICARFHYANGDSPYAKFPVFLPVRIRGVPVYIWGSVSDGSAIFPWVTIKTVTSR